jgi:hypothetical protein
VILSVISTVLIFAPTPPRNFSSPKVLFLAP